MVRVLTRELDHPNERVREHACNCLRMIGPDAAAAVPALTVALGEETLVVPLSAASALGHIGPAAAPQLVHALGHERGQVCVLAAQALGYIGSPAACSAVGPLIEILVEEENVGFPDPGCAWAAAAALGQMGSAAKPAVPLLASTLGAREDLARQMAAVALGNLGSMAIDTLPELERATQDRNRLVRDHAREAIRKIRASSSLRSVEDR